MEEHKKKNDIGLYGSVILLIILIVVAGYSLYSIYENAKGMANGQGTGISKNWAEAMNWLKNETPECTLVASYWDPGYWIAALSERKVVYDGGSQGSTKRTKTEDLNGLDCMADRGGYIEEKNGTEYCVTSRMQDMAGSLYTSNETKAAKILETYSGNCSDIYFLTYDRLIGISHWWSYFSNWDPEKGKGQAYEYAVIGLQDQKELMFEDGVTLIYGPFYLKIVSENGTQKMEPLLLQQGRYYKIKNLVMIQNSTLTKMSYPNATVPGTLWVSLDGTSFSLPEGKCTSISGTAYCISRINVQGHCYPYNEDFALCRPYAIYMPEQIENSMFTKMFFYNGADLEYFEPAYINPEVKLFKFNIKKFREDLEEGTLGKITNKSIIDMSTNYSIPKNESTTNKSDKKESILKEHSFNDLVTQYYYLGLTSSAKEDYLKEKEELYFSGTGVIYDIEDVFLSKKKRVILKDNSQIIASITMKESEGDKLKELKKGYPFSFSARLKYSGFTTGILFFDEGVVK